METVEAAKTVVVVKAVEVVRAVASSNQPVRQSASHQASQPGHRFFNLFNLFKTCLNNNGPKVMQIVRASSLFLKKRYENEHMKPLKMLVVPRAFVVFEILLTYKNNEKLRVSLGIASFYEL